MRVDLLFELYILEFSEMGSVPCILCCLAEHGGFIDSVEDGVDQYLAEKHHDEYRNSGIHVDPAVDEEGMPSGERSVRDSDDQCEPCNGCGFQPGAHAFVPGTMDIPDEEEVRAEDDYEGGRA